MMTIAPVPEQRGSFLDRCFVEGHSEEDMRVRRNRRRALLLSIVLEILMVAALVLFPLLIKGENIAGRVVMFPALPYPSGGHANHRRDPAPAPRTHPDRCRFCPPSPILKTIDRHDASQTRGSSETGDPEFPLNPGVISGDGPTGAWTTTNAPPRPAPPVPDPPARKRPKISELLQTAMLIRRVRPAYPHLAVELRREGRVELHAVISTDGSIQMLEVISGDPLLVGSALDAVREWRYRPTILNGQAVEVDTHITVVYTLSN